jgi:hypothetical protein
MFILTLGKKINLVKITSQKNHVLFMLKSLVKMNISFDQCERFNQVKLFEKP